MRLKKKQFFMRTLLSHESEKWYGNENRDEQKKYIFSPWHHPEACIGQRIGGYLAHLRHIDFSPTQKSSLPQHG
jgi:hypothetical protein